MSSPIRRSRLLRRGRKVGARKVRVPAVGTALAVALLAMTPATPVAAARSATAYDVNGDGWPHLAVGLPGDPVGDLARAAAVHVINGSRTGLTASGSRTWNQGSPGIQGVPPTDDSFRASNTPAVFDEDRCADLSIGVPGGGLGAVAVL